MADPKKEAAERLIAEHFADFGAASRAAAQSRPDLHGLDLDFLNVLDLPEGEPGLLFRGLAAQRESGEGLGQTAAAEFYSAHPDVAESYSMRQTPVDEADLEWLREEYPELPDPPVRGKRHTWPEDVRPRVKAVLHTPTNVLDLTGESAVPQWALDILEEQDPGATARLQKAQKAYAMSGATSKDAGPTLDLPKVDKSQELFEEAKKRGHSTVKFRDYSGMDAAAGVVNRRKVSYVPLEDVETVGVYDTSQGALSPGRGRGEKLPESAKQLELPFDPNVDPNISDKLKRFLKKLPAIGTAVGAALIPGEVQAAYDRGGETEAAKVLAVELARMGDPGFELLYELAAAVPDAASYIARLGASKRELQRPAGEKMY